MILIGDASGHPIGDPKNSMNLDERSVKDLAKEKSVYVASIYVSGKQSDAGNFDRARPQFETMAAGDGEHVSFSRVTGSEEATLEVSLRDQIDHIVKYLSTGDFGAVMSESTGSDDVAGQAIAGAVRAALVD
ncbi:hypothetical protein NKJ35_28955 [Mesorhizobium sp. M0136]|uniref:hypothetical protein n=1 Tax=Mesorhizobium sp. M0136 TaxID=2956890 RepID=UPI003336623D